MALTTLSQVKQFLNVTSSGQDLWLDSLRQAAEARVKQYCKREFERQTRTEFYSGAGQRMIVLRHTPAVSITSLYMDSFGHFGQSNNPFPPETILVQGVDYELGLDGPLDGSQVSYSGIIYRVDTVWPEAGRTYTPGKLSAESGPALGNVKVTYVAGYATIPDDLQYAVCLLTSYFKNTVATGGIPLEDERLGDYSYRLHFPVRPNEYTHPQLGELYAILNTYRDQSFGWA